MSAEDNVKLVKGIMEEFMRTGDPTSFFPALTPDAVIKAVIPEGTPISGDFRGRNGFIRYFQRWAETMEVLDIRDIEYTSSEDKVVLLAVEKARVKRTGAIFECETATVFTVEDGRIAKIVALADMSAIVAAYPAV